MRASNSEYAIGYRDRTTDKHLLIHLPSHGRSSQAYYSKHATPPALKSGGLEGVLRQCGDAKRYIEIEWNTGGLVLDSHTFDVTTDKALPVEFAGKWGDLQTWSEPTLQKPLSKASIPWFKQRL